MALKLVKMTNDNVSPAFISMHYFPAVAVALLQSRAGGEDGTATARALLARDVAALDDMSMCAPNAT